MVYSNLVVLFLRKMVLPVSVISMIERDVNMQRWFFRRKKEKDKVILLNCRGKGPWKKTDTSSEKMKKKKKTISRAKI